MAPGKEGYTDCLDAHGSVRRWLTLPGEPRCSRRRTRASRTQVPPSARQPRSSATRPRWGNSAAAPRSRGSIPDAPDGGGMTATPAREHDERTVVRRTEGALVGAPPRDAGGALPSVQMTGTPGNGTFGIAVWAAGGLTASRRPRRRSVRSGGALRLVGGGPAGVAAAQTRRFNGQGVIQNASTVMYCPPIFTIFSV